MKILIEILLSLFLHPLAVILMLINLAGRGDLTILEKLLWAVVGIFAWGIGPIMYILLGEGTLW